MSDMLVIRKTYLVCRNSSWNTNEAKWFLRGYYICPSDPCNRMTGNILWTKATQFWEQCGLGDPHNHMNVHSGLGHRVTGRTNEFDIKCWMFYHSHSNYIPKIVFSQQLDAENAEILLHFMYYFRWPSIFLDLSLFTNLQNSLARPMTVPGTCRYSLSLPGHRRATWLPRRSSQQLARGLRTGDPAALGVPASWASSKASWGLLFANQFTVHRGCFSSLTHFL